MIECELRTVHLILGNESTNMPETNPVSETQQIAFKLAEYLTQALCFSGSLRPDTDLLEEGLVDSLMILDVVEHIHATYGVSLNADDLKPQHFRSTAAMSELLMARRTSAQQISMS